MEIDSSLSKRCNWKYSFSFTARAQPPEFTEKFVEQTITEKTNLTLTCRVIGNPTPEVKWFRDETQMQPTFKVKMTRDGEVCTLQVTGVTQKMTGVYKCVATNIAGE